MSGKDQSSRATEIAVIERAWEAEIQRRLDEYRRGEVQTIPSSEVFAKARALLR